MPVQVAVIGCGSFARGVHLPNLRTLSEEYTLRAVADIDGDLAKKTGEEFGATYYTTDYREILSDPQIEFTIICTRHDQHGPMSLEAVEAGKHVLVEKPMATKLEHLRPLLEAIRRKGVIFSVGHNRRYSPLSRKLSEMVRDREYPVMVNYRMVDEIWQHPWALDPEKGGGRIISESVHLFEFATWLVGAEPVRVYAEGGQLTHPHIPDTHDNVIVVMRFADGSLATFAHGDLGSAKYPKERIEVFFGRKTAVIDNFERLEAFGFPEKQEIVLPAMDKGMLMELRELASVIRGGVRDTVTELDGARAVLCALMAIESIRTGTPQTINLNDLS